MFSVISCLAATHDWRFVAGAISMCMIGAFSTVIMLTRAQDCARDHRRVWIAAAAATGGTSIWATHFIAMLAYDGGYPISYDAGITAVSILVAMGMCWAAFTAAFRWPSLPGVIGAGCLFGLGISAMHFTGMLAVSAAARLTYAPGPVAVAVGSSFLFGSLSLLAVRFLTGYRRILAGTVLVTTTVCALHFTSMGAVTLVPDPLVVARSLFPIDHPVLAAIVAAVSSAIVLLGGAAALMDRYLTDVRGLADAAMEGLIFVQDGRIVEANRSLVQLHGGNAADLRGRKVSEILPHQPAAFFDAATRFGELIKADGSCVDVEVLSRELEYRGRQSLVYVVRDLTERRRSERMIDHLARHDPLTGLANRREFDLCLTHLLGQRAPEDQHVALLCLDLDNFKTINDTRGHAAGDAVLRKVADVLKDAAGPNDFVARLGGDEFAIVQRGEQQPATARALAEAVMARIGALTQSDPALPAFGTSIGVAIAAKGDVPAETLHAHADAALYEAKKSGRGAVRLYDAELEARIKRKRQVEAELLEALASEQFGLDFEPFTGGADGTLLGYRASICWEHPVQGRLKAGDFLPLAEEHGLLNRVVAWMFERAAAEAQLWPNQLRLAVPLPCHRLLSSACYEQLSRILRCAGLDPRRLDLVIPASALGSADACAAATLQRFKGLGVGIIVTDFLAEHSALTALQGFGFERVRVDAASFLRLRDRFSAKAHDAALQFLDAVGIGCIARDVETGTHPMLPAGTSNDPDQTGNRVELRYSTPISFSASDAKRQVLN
ncbi:MAG TPA: diguanylate cyclase [Devosia sp.]|jgi:diguanylate cyclase (GGDEF)-like protein/PAS domain S-box-containing protein|uniref:bifunctional diguanylate cyclase/phosphodiesterase n=1 Tax=Devosia sp. TaxID=1871048 RepID=UPI002F9276E5